MGSGSSKVTTKYSNLFLKNSPINVSQREEVSCSMITFIKKHSEQFVEMHNRMSATNGDYAVHCVVRNNLTDVLKEMLKLGIDINVKGYGGNTPLHRCIGKECVNTLLEEGADVTIINEYGQTVLHKMVQYKQITVDPIKTVVDMGLIDVNRVDKLGNSVLHYSLLNDTITEFILKIGLNPNAENRKGETPLNCIEISSNVIKLLLEAGSYPNAKSNTGVTPLHVACGSLHTTSSGCQWEFSKEKLNSIKLLLEAGADPNAVDENGRTPLHYLLNKYSVIGNFYKAVELMVNYGVDFYIADDDGVTAYSIGKKYSYYNSMYGNVIELFDRVNDGIHIRRYVTGGSTTSSTTSVKTQSTKLDTPPSYSTVA